ncbi:MBL fold metallo-hydrolase [Anderseniella sp. Alg231-50]|uniref:MBL fold metallo-hydrolase n=1 Tax=Anderseniella sp. Alg231-50 TaxID=1922226 RepID=UPI000D5598FD
MSDINEGLQSWQLRTNHNAMIEHQWNERPAPEQTVALSYFGSSAFRITSPSGITVMLDPWRNLPTRRWDWYFYDFPKTAVDIGVATHAHFDHDALHRLDAHVLLDRLIGVYEFADVRITGIADKHATDSSSASYDFKKIIREFGNVDIEPPNNPRSWDNCLIIVETGGLRILHWGDNRHNPPDEVWQAIGPVDIALLPVDESQHVMGFQHTEAIIDRLQPKVVVPHHYYIWDVVQRSSTLMPAEPWVRRQQHTRWLDSATTQYSAGTLPADAPTIDYFGDHVAFDKASWHDSKGG